MAALFAGEITSGSPAFSAEAFPLNLLAMVHLPAMGSTSRPFSLAGFSFSELFTTGLFTAGRFRAGYLAALILFGTLMMPPAFSQPVGMPGPLTSDAHAPAPPQASEHMSQSSSSHPENISGGKVKLHFGLRAGRVRSTIAPKTWGRTLGWKSGLVAGAFVNVNFPGPLSLQPEVQYIQKGASQARLSSNIAGRDLGGELTLSLDYVEVPIFTRFRIKHFEIELPGTPRGTPSVVAPILELGPYLGMNVRSRVSTDLRPGDSGGNVSRVRRLVDRVSKAQCLFEAGIVGGFGADFRSRFGSLSITGRYRHGLAAFGSGESAARNQAFTLSVGIGRPI